MATAAPLLNLDTLIERPTVVIDGVSYELLLPDTLPVVDYVRLDRLRTRFRDAWNTSEKDDFSSEAADQIEKVLDQLVRVVLKAPDDVQARLTDAQRLSVYQTFLQLPRLSRLTSTATKRVEAKKTATKKRTGAR